MMGTYDTARGSPLNNPENDYEPGISEDAEFDFNKWFKEIDLGNLEDVREYVLAHAVQNGEGNWETAKTTVLLYLDDPEMADVFDYYRKPA